MTIATLNKIIRARSRLNVSENCFWKKQMINYPILVSIFFCVLLFSACEGQQPKQDDPQIFTKDADVYVAGDENNTATYWKNGKAVHLTNPDNFSHASGIAISVNDVYVSGYQTNNKDSAANNSTSPNTVVVTPGSVNLPRSGTIAGYWKNKTFVKITDGAVNADASAIAISGKDIYIAGYECNGRKASPGSDDLKNAVAKYWKNGVPVVLTNGSNPAKATAIAVTNTNVFAVGYEELGPNHLREARCWMNGKQINLKIDKNLNHGSDYSEANAVFVDGDNVYIAGTESGLAAYWKNGIPVRLVNRAKGQPGQVDDIIVSSAHAIAVSGKDIYVAGAQDTLASTNTVAKYWKNGRPISLTHAPLDLKSNVFIALSGKDTYLAYSLLDGSDERSTMLWKNGHNQAMSSTVTAVSALLIIKHP
ncbi:putative RecA/RadA family phage recombinase [Pedobacter sp. UYP24]